MQLVDTILTHLSTYHIKGRFFRMLLSNYLGSKTSHFIHEFYSFMRSPYDMIGYDRHVLYRERGDNYSISLSDDSDSDVAIVGVSEQSATSNIQVNNNPFSSPRLEVIEINSASSDSDVIIQPPVISPVINLIDSDSEIAIPTQINQRERTSSSEENRKPLLPLKIRLKHKRQSKEKRSKLKRRHRSSSSSSSSSNESCQEERSKKKKRHRKSKRKESKSHKKSHKSHSRKKYSSGNSSSNSDNEPLLSRHYKHQRSDSEDYIPLSKLKHKEKRKSGRRESKTDLEMNITLEKINYSLDRSCASLDRNNSNSDRNIFKIERNNYNSERSNGNSERNFERSHGNLEKANTNLEKTGSSSERYNAERISTSSERNHGSSRSFNNSDRKYSRSEKINYNSEKMYNSLKNHTASRNYSTSQKLNEEPQNIKHEYGFSNNTELPSCSYSNERYNENLCDTYSNQYNDQECYESENKTDILNSYLYSSPMAQNLRVDTPESSYRVKHEYDDNYYAGPSNSSGRLRSVIVKRENSKNMWYLRPYINSDTSDDD